MFSWDLTPSIYVNSCSYACIPYSEYSCNVLGFWWEDKQVKLWILHQVKYTIWDFYKIQIQLRCHRSDWDLEVDSDLDGQGLNLQESDVVWCPKEINKSSIHTGFITQDYKMVHAQT